MNIYILCAVRGKTDDHRKSLEDYVSTLENEGHNVHLPHRDTNQNGIEFEICKQNKEAIKWADEIHIFYEPESKGSHFDLGMVFMIEKPIKIIENVNFDSGKCFSRMIEQWKEFDK